MSTCLNVLILLSLICFVGLSVGNVLSVVGFEFEVPPNYQLVWSDEFNGADGSPPDRNTWYPESGGDGWGNNELEYYTNRINNSYVYNGSLIIQALKEEYGGRGYTSARLDTANSVSFLYGIMAFRIKIQMADGLWPAAWQMGESFPRVGWPRCGEIDIFEIINGRDGGTIDDSSILHGTLHMNQFGENDTRINHVGYGGTVNSTKGSYWGDDWHVYSTIWNSTSFSFAVDDMAYYTADLTSQPSFNSFTDPSNPFYFVINLAVGGNFPNHKVDDSIFPAHLMVDYVRVYQTTSQIQYQKENVVKPIRDPAWRTEQKRIRNERARTSVSNSKLE